MKESKFYLYCVIAGQVFFFYELFSILFYPSYFNFHYEIYEIVNYFFTFLIQFALMVVFFLNLRGKLRYTTPIILVPILGQIMQGVYILFRTEGGSRTKIRLAVIYYLLFVLAVISSAYVQIPQGFPAPISELRVFAITLAISDLFNVAVLLYLFLIFKKWKRTV